MGCSTEQADGARKESPGGLHPDLKKKGHSASVCVVLGVAGGGGPLSPLGICPQQSAGSVSRGSSAFKSLPSLWSEPSRGVSMCTLTVVTCLLSQERGRWLQEEFRERL